MSKCVNCKARINFCTGNNSIYAHEMKVCLQECIIKV